MILFDKMSLHKLSTNKWFLIIIFIISIILFIEGFILYRENNIVTNLSFDLNLGNDQGQSLGSLLSYNNKDFEFGVGFSERYGTNIRGNQRILQIYIKDYKKKEPGQFTPISKPYIKYAGSILTNEGNTLIARPYTQRIYTYSDVKILDTSTNSWKDAQRPECYGRKGRIDNKEFVLSCKGITYDEKDLLENFKPDILATRIFYYTNGIIYVFDQNNPSYIKTCRWFPQEQKTIDYNACEKKEVGSDQTFPYVITNFKQYVLFALNNGDLILYKDGKFRKKLENTERKSNQFYTAINYYDQLLLGHYPTGQIFVFNPQTEDIDDFPYKISYDDEMPDTKREAQSLVIFGGDLYLGVWPWGKVYKFDNQTKTWTFIQRLFSGPSITTDSEGPYPNITEKIDQPMEYNEYKQRVTGMIPVGNTLYASTSNKSGIRYPSAEKLIDNTIVDEYGKVWAMRKDDVATCMFEWKEKTQISVKITGNKIKLFQDANFVCEINKPSNFSNWDIKKVKFGQGCFGNFNGMSLTPIK